MSSYLIKDTTKEERKEIVKKALAISLTESKMPSQDVLNLSKEYIEGKKELKEIQKIIIEKYKSKEE